MVAYLRENSSDDERTQHLSSDVLVERDGDAAAVSANLVVHYYRPGREPFRAAGLRWRFDAVRGPSGWRFARAEVAPLWFRPAA
ncbi:nuclear transport factor 2 family protein [Spirillospora sp. CA-294931]|uniref:nuclear transport factor 2 family protein n=1 Tax=Spirillospora sp. CA-294931 TaxID=3240042 RepID=UPI003D8F5D46